ncbi:hypothetical protein ACH5RR_017376 [Cinchona calisaya]|uniref:Inositol-tetrakisphosphate 1-kinase n=1 Tax=Cinchona calisaya TaxID=153742 RepID=A0ABD3A185_9GENT
MSEEDRQGSGGEEISWSSTNIRYRIGYALSPKKVESFIKPSLLNLAHQRRIDLIPIDPCKPLIQQGPFDCVLHKLSGHQWDQQLRLYSSLNPTVPIIDPPDAIRRLHNRASMLQVVSDLQIPHQSDEHLLTFGIPHQIFVQDSQLLSDGDPTTLSGLEFPVIAKPLVADGTANSHQMSLVFNQEGLKGLEAPLVLQEFVNHGGVVFKVYVAGVHVQCVKRRSLPDISDSDDVGGYNLMTFSQISNLKDDKKDSYIEMPPVSFLTDLAQALRNALSLHLFNFDVIRDSRSGNHRYLVIDINYFPGYAKIPSYETLLTDFFLDIIHSAK